MVLARRAGFDYPGANRERASALKSGDTIFYPAHGVAKVIGIEERQFGDLRQEFYILELNRGGKSLVPTKHVESAGLRPLISAKRAKELLKQLKDVPKIDRSKSWKDRASQYSDGLRTGSPESYTAILQELMYRARADKLSTTETKMLETARSYFVAEVGEVLNIPAERLEKDLADAIAALLPQGPKGEDGEDLEGEGEEDLEAEGGDDEAEAAPKAKKAAKKTSKAASKKAPAKKAASKKSGSKKAKK